MTINSTLWEDERDVIITDVDEVLANWLGGFLPWYNKRKGTSWRKEQMFSYDWADVIGGTPGELRALAIEYALSGGIEEIAPVEGAQEGISELARLGRIVAATARPEEWRVKTREWLRLFPEVEESYFTGAFFGGTTTKGDVCKRVGARIILEDQLKYAKECASRGIYVVLFDRPWNQGKIPSDVVRVSSWSEVPQIVSDLQKKYVA